MDLSERISKYLDACPPAISGNKGHNSALYVASVLVNGFDLSVESAYGYIENWNTKCNPPWSEKELRHKLDEAVKLGNKKGRGFLLNGNGEYRANDSRVAVASARKQPPQKVVIDPATAIEVLLKGFKAGEGDLYDASPIKPSSDFTQDGQLLLQHLYRPGEIINFVTAWKWSVTKDGEKKVIPDGYGESVERDELIDIWSLGMPSSEAGGWMRMNPTDGAGIADKNVTNHRFILLEFDEIPLDLQINFFAKIPLPIAAILTSGGKSVHAWVKADALDYTGYHDDVVTLIKMIARFGIDEANKNPSRLSRLVGVVRTHGASGDGRQRLLYLNPEPSQSAIL